MKLTDKELEALRWVLSAITPVLTDPQARKHRDVLEALLKDNQ